MMLTSSTLPVTLAPRLFLASSPGRSIRAQHAGAGQAPRPNVAMSFPRRAQRLQAQRQSVSQPSGRLWMLAASRSVQQQESEARQELDDLEAEREAAMQAGVSCWADYLQVILKQQRRFSRFA